MWYLFLNPSVTNGQGWDSCQFDQFYKMLAVPPSSFPYQQITILQNHKKGQAFGIDGENQIGQWTHFVVHALQGPKYSIVFY